MQGLEQAYHHPCQSTPRLPRSPQTFHQNSQPISNQERRGKLRCITRRVDFDSLSSPKVGSSESQIRSLIPKVMASDHDPRYFPFYSGESSAKQAYDVGGPSRGNTGISQNMLRGQAYQAHVPNPSSDHLVRAVDYYRTEGCLNHVQRPDNHTSRAHRQYYSDPDLNADRAAIRGFPILADNYQLERRPHVKVERPNHENCHPHVIPIGELKHRHASMAVSEAITEPELNGRARLQQSFETRRRVREPRSAMH